MLGKGFDVRPREVDVEEEEEDAEAGYGGLFGGSAVEWDGDVRKVVEEGGGRTSSSSSVRARRLKRRWR